MCTACGEMVESLKDFEKTNEKNLLHSKQKG